MKKILTLNNLEGDWREIFNKVIDSEYFNWLDNFLDNQYKYYDIVPKLEHDLLFRCFKETSAKDTNIVFLGTSPYSTYVSYPEIPTHDGLLFSGSKSFKTPDPLQILFRELQRYYGIDDVFMDSDLTRWANQGILLLNNTHTTIHRGTKATVLNHTEAWENFTKFIVNTLNKKDDVIWVLFGADNNKYNELITNNASKVFRVGFPSSYNSSNSFIGTCLFEEINKELESRDKSKINWI